MAKIGEGSLQCNEVVWMIIKTTGKGGVHKILKDSFAECIYYIWSQRNRKIFDKHNCQKQQIIVLSCDLLLACTKSRCVLV